MSAASLIRFPLADIPLQFTLYCSAQVSNSIAAFQPLTVPALFSVTAPSVSFPQAPQPLDYRYCPYPPGQPVPSVPETVRPARSFQHEQCDHKEEAAARWRLDLGTVVAGSQQTWPVDVTARMSELEWLTLVTEALVPVWDDLTPEFEEAHQQNQPDQRPGEVGPGDDGGIDDLGVNQVYSEILDAAAMCNRWLHEDLGPGLSAGRQEFEPPMALDPAVDIDHWARERTGPGPEEPAGEDYLERWLRWADLRTAGILPEETASREEWSEAVGHSLVLVREAIHRLTLARLHLRAGDRALLEANVAVQITENVYRVVTWLASTLQAWGIALVRVHGAVREPGESP